MNTIKEARLPLEPLFLHLVNQVIKTSTYPQRFKVTKVIPIPKDETEKNNIDGWRPINIVPAVAKIIEKCLLKQMLKYLEDTKLIKHSHHGSVKTKSTQTLVLELQDKLVENLEKGDETVLLILDQSKAYDLVQHDILLEKMRILNFSQKSLTLMENYLKNRQQYVEIEGFHSETLPVGDKSVTQGSTLSCLLYLIFIMDIPMICHDKIHQPLDYRNCSQPSIETFVDDNFVSIKIEKQQDMKDQIIQTIKKIQNYMDSNKLALNAKKTKIMILSNNKTTKKNFSIQVQDKIIKHSSRVKILGTYMTEDLSWDNNIENHLIPSLKNRLRTLKYITPYMDNKFRKMYINAIFRGKILFGIETWGGAKATNITKLQNLQNSAAKLALKSNPRNNTMSNRQRHNELSWLMISEEIKYATMKLTHKILNKGKPEELTALMPANKNGLRIESQNKLNTKPKYLMKNRRTQNTFRNRAYIYNVLPGRITSLENHEKFKKWTKVHLRNPSNVPKDLLKTKNHGLIRKNNDQHD